jgi:hypothetical protein
LAKGEIISGSLSLFTGTYSIGGIKGDIPEGSIPEEVSDTETV